MEVRKRDGDEEISDYCVGLYPLLGVDHHIMPASLPLRHKTPFVLDPRPRPDCASPPAGLLNVSRTARRLHLPDVIASHRSIQQRALTTATLDAALSEANG